MTDRRRLIVNADDFGLSHGVNLGIIEGHTQGIVTSTSLMVRMPAVLEAVELAKATASLGVGLHVDIGEWRCDGEEWIPVYERAPQDDAQALSEEVTRQLSLFRDLMGREPTHLDSHQHAHLREPLRSIMASLADALGVPVRHLTPGFRYLGDFYAQDEKGQSLPGRLTSGFLCATLQGLSAGVTELCCHPAAVVDFEGAYQSERIGELSVLCSSDVRLAVEQCPIELVSFGECAPPDRPAVT